MSSTSTRDIPLLTARDIDCRVQSVSKNKKGNVGAILLLYKDARVDMRILDQVFGSGNWQRTHEVVNGNLFCNIDVWDDDKKAWVRKQDVGVESNTEKEKGQASDAFKRAGFNWGIGRELYSAPFVYVELYDGEYYTDTYGQKNTIKCSAGTKFIVQHIDYNEQREVSELVIIDRNGEVRYDMMKRSSSPKASTSKSSKPSVAPDQQEAYNLAMQQGMSVIRREDAHRHSAAYKARLDQRGLMRDLKGLIIVAAIMAVMLTITIASIILAAI